MKQGSLYPHATVILQSQTTLAGTTALYGTQYQRDKLGRITRKIERNPGSE